MKVICGLGNPGGKYEKTRHNAGWMAVDILSDTSGAVFRTMHDICSWAETNINGNPVYLLKPLTYMNKSGEAVKYFLSKKNIPLSDLIVIQDDLDLDLGTLRIKLGGGHGGHNGIKSISFSVSSNNFARIRIGIGRDNNTDPADYVLSPFKKSEMPVINETLEKAALAVKELAEGIDIIKVMNKYN